MSTKHSQAIPMYLNIENETIEVTACIEYTVTPGRPATGPSYASGGEPAEGAEIEITEVEIAMENGANQQAPQWLFNLLARSDGVYQTLGDHADWGHVGPDPDEAYERMRDEASEP